MYTMVYPPDICFKRENYDKFKSLDQRFQLDTSALDKPSAWVSLFGSCAQHFSVNPFGMVLSENRVEFQALAIMIWLSLCKWRSKAYHPWLYQGFGIVPIHWFIMIFPLQWPSWSEVWRDTSGLPTWSLRNVRPALLMESLATRASFPCHPKLDGGSWILG